VINRIFFFILLAALPPAQAAEPPVLRFCSIDVDFAPVARVDGTGHYQFLLKEAARKASSSNAASRRAAAAWTNFAPVSATP
jgi:hypothetical protein